MDEPSITPPPILGPPTGLDREAFTLAYLEVFEEECPACGYNVHRLTEPRCPECGRKLAVQVISTLRGYSWPWVIMLLTLGLSAGIGLLVLAVEVQEGFREHGPFAIVLVYFMASIPLPVILLGVRRWFIRMPTALQFGLMGLAGIATLGMLTWFMMLIES